jgi:hypothetical protein
MEDLSHSQGPTSYSPITQHTWAVQSIRRHCRHCRHRRHCRHCRHRHHHHHHHHHHLVDREVLEKLTAKRSLHYY